MPQSISITEKDALLLIDLQRDFCPGGALPVPDGDSILPLINAIAPKFTHILLTQDWHPANHHSFASQHPGKTPYDQIDAPYGQQTLWPNHCVQGTLGAEFHPALDRDQVLNRAELILRKGFRAQIDSYSAFQENDKQTPTGLAAYLRERGFERIFLAGLAYDFCVRYSAIDGAQAGFAIFLIEDACRAIGIPATASSPGSIAATHSDFAKSGVISIPTRALSDTR